MTGTQNITFKGLEFSQSRQDGVGLREIVNVDFVDCTFKDIAARAISNGCLLSKIVFRLLMLCL